MNAPSTLPVPMPTEGQLMKLFPRANRAVVREIVGGVDYFDLAKIHSVSRMAMFLAQFGHETGGLRRLTEDLDYSAERMTEVWPGRYPTVADAMPYAHNPVALANKTYGGRMGNVRPTDGWTYRGRGPGVTGRDAYREVGRCVDQPFEGNPDLVAAPFGAFVAAIGVWIWKDMNPSADRDDVASNTRKLNGGLIGLADRRALYGLAKVLLRG